MYISIQNSPLRVKIYLYQSKSNKKCFQQRAEQEQRERKICKSVPLFSKWETNAKMAIECEGV